MEHLSNEQKAQQIIGCNRVNCLECGGSLSVANGCTEFERIIAMAEWKDGQFENAINEIKVNIIEARDNKEYYETNREITLNWILRLIDECCESILIQKENKL